MAVGDRITEYVERLVAMGAKFEALDANVRELMAQQNELRERVARLEAQLPTVKEAAAREARSAAHVGVYELQAQLVERLTRLEEHVRSLGPRTDHGRITGGES